MKSLQRCGDESNGQAIVSDFTKHLLVIYTTAQYAEQYIITIFESAEPKNYRSAVSDLHLTSIELLIIGITGGSSCPIFY